VAQALPVPPQWLILQVRARSRDPGHRGRRRRRRRPPRPAISAARALLPPQLPAPVGTFHAIIGLFINPRHWPRGTQPTWATVLPPRRRTESPPRGAAPL
jgi:hypothetical protein